MQLVSQHAQSPFLEIDCICGNIVLQICYMMRCCCRWASSYQPSAISMASCCARSEHCGVGMVQLHLLGPGKHGLYVSMHLEAY